MASASVGELLREWRTRRRRSQMDLSIEVGVSTRHLSFVETGRSKPSPELVLAVADRLDVPLRERNRLLLAAGYAPRFGARPLDDPSMAKALEALRRMLDAHDPYPGVVIDRRWDVLVANAAADRLTAGLPPEVVEPRVNVFRACLHPEGLSGATTNFGDWASYLLRQLRRMVELTGDPDLVELEREVLDYPTVSGLDVGGPVDDRDDPPLLVPFRYQVAGVELSLFTTLTTFGTPRDVTLEELCVELFFPADDATEQLLRGG
jgi:transcriptional regulator with XRE-family HTH domain